MKYEYTDYGPLPICETDEERLCLEAASADMELLQRQLGQAGTPKAVRVAIAAWKSRPKFANC